MSIIAGMIFGFIVWFLVRYLVAGLFTVNQNERAVKTSFGRAERLGNATTLEDPISECMSPDDRTRYSYPQVRVIPPGGPYFKWPWEKVWKVPVATQTVSMAFDPEDPSANVGGTQLTAVTKDQLDTGLTGQIRYRVSERNLFAYLFGVKRPIVHVMGYFISVLRERIANFEAPKNEADVASAIAGVSINDLRKNLASLNEHMDRECRSAEARYGIVLMRRSSPASIRPPRWKARSRRSTRRIIPSPATSRSRRRTPTKRSCNRDAPWKSKRSTRRPKSSRSPRSPKRSPP